MLRLRVLLLVAAAACADERPNVLLLSLDSVRADHTGPGGHRNPAHPDVPVTPRIDRLAETGVVFENAVSTTSWTLPAHMALFTGLSDELHGVVDNESSLDPALVTLAELLSQRGYATAGFYSGPYLNPLFGFGQGFDHYENCGLEVPLGVFEGGELGGWRDVHQHSHETVTSRELLEATSAWIRAHAHDGPFFVLVHWWDPHYDYKAPLEYAARFDADYRGAWTGVRDEDIQRPRAPADLAHVLALYDAEIAYTDHHIGGLLDLLDELGLYSDTLVVVTSDHGEEFYERTRWGHQRTLKDEVLRVPLVMRLSDRIPAGARVRGQARLQDVFATIADLAGIDPPSYVEGRSLRALWEDPEHPGFTQPLYLCVPHRDIRVSGVRTLETKAVWDHSAGKGAVWNLVDDPAERAPRAFDAHELAGGEHAGIRALRSWLESLEATRAALPSTPGRARGPVLDEATWAELEALGYVESDD